MTASEYLLALHKAGFNTQPLWSAKEPGKRTGVESHVIYAPDGNLLTSIVIRSYDFNADGSNEIAVYFCAEGNSVQSDVEDLKGMWSRLVTRLARRKA